MSKNKQLLLAGLAAGAYAYFRKKENRDKAIAAFNDTKEKMNTFLDNQKTTILPDDESAETTDITSEETTN